MPPSAELRRVAMLAVHTSPVARPGVGDAGGLNVYVAHTAAELAARGVEVEIFTRATSGAEPDVVTLVDGVLVRNVPAGPYEGLGKEDLPGQLCAFAAGVMRAVAARPEGWYDVVHSHYWLSGQVGWLAADRWQVPLVHTMHTMARVKNAALAEGDDLEPVGREIGEAQVVEVADRLVANTETEAAELIRWYDADPAKVRVVHPGVDLDVFTPGDQAASRRAVGLGERELVLAFVGRLQPLKAPDLLVRAAGDLLARRPELADRLRVVVLGGPSGPGGMGPQDLTALAARVGLGDRVRVLPPVDRALLAQWYRAADLVAVPSYNESFGLVALEAQACGTPVVAADVGGLPVAVGGGILVPGHEVGRWSRALEELADDPPRREALGRAGARHAQGFSWSRTTEALAEVYREAMAARAADVRGSSVAG